MLFSQAFKNVFPKACLIISPIMLTILLISTEYIKNQAVKVSRGGSFVGREASRHEAIDHLGIM